MYFVVPLAFRRLDITTGWVLASFGFISNTVYGKSPVVYVGWTLEWEMLFYLIFGASLWFRTQLVTLTVTILVLLLFSLAVSNFILVEFIAGLLIALVFKRLEISCLGKTSLIIGSILLLLSINHEFRAFIGSREIVWGIPSALIVYGAVTTTQLNSKIGQLLGDASYSIYLIQVISIPLFYKLISYTYLRLNSDFLAIICLVGVAIGGIITHKIIEKPATQYIKTQVYGFVESSNVSNQGSKGGDQQKKLNITEVFDFA